MPGLGDQRRERLARARLYAVTGAREELGDLETFLNAVLEAGADIVQLREKGAEAGDLLRWSKAFRAAADRYGAVFVMNDRPDVAIAAGADGVHLGQNDLPAAIARQLVGPEMLIGLSTHSPAEFDAGAPEADYLCTGPIYATPTKPGRPATGLEIVTHDRRHRHPTAAPSYRGWSRANRGCPGGRRAGSGGLGEGFAGGARRLPRFLTIT
jgi:thiamine-phosphate pyrophosphorylase